MGGTEPLLTEPEIEKEIQREDVLHEEEVKEADVQAEEPVVHEAPPAV